MPESPIRVYYADDPRLAHTLSGHLAREIADRSYQIARGLAEDWGDYKERVGFIKGMEEALKIATSTEEELRGENARRSA